MLTLRSGFKDESFFFNDTANTEIYTLSLHDALPIYRSFGTCACMPTRCSMASKAEISRRSNSNWRSSRVRLRARRPRTSDVTGRSEEHTSELQSRQYLVCRLLLEKKK